MALAVLNYSEDEETLPATLLYETVSHTTLLLEGIENNFGKAVAFLVGKMTDKNQKGLISSIEKAYLGCVKDYEHSRTDIIKLMNRLHNLLTIQHEPYTSKR